MKNTCDPLTLSVTPAEMKAWMPLLGSGIGLSVTPGITLQEFLCEQLGIDADYLDRRVQTILVNHRAVDDADQIHIGDGDIIALSAAMPGLAGATLRRGGHLSAMRGEISHGRQSQPGTQPQTGVVTLKLFNLVAKEIAPIILAGKIWLKPADLRYLASRNPKLAITRPPADETDWIQLRILAK